MLLFGILLAGRHQRIRDRTFFGSGWWRENSLHRTFGLLSLVTLSSGHDVLLHILAFAALYEAITDETDIPRAPLLKAEVIESTEASTSFKCDTVSPV